MRPSDALRRSYTQIQRPIFCITCSPCQAGPVFICRARDNYLVSIFSIKIVFNALGAGFLEVLRGNLYEIRNGGLLGVWVRSLAYTVVS